MVVLHIYEKSFLNDTRNSFVMFIGEFCYHIRGIRGTFNFNNSYADITYSTDKKILYLLKRLIDQNIDEFRVNFSGF